MSKQWVLGGVSRDCRQCLLHTINDRSEHSIIPWLYEKSDPDGIVFTDEFPVYYQIPNRLSVCHKHEFVKSEAPFIHTNTQEGIWGHLKPLGRHVYRGFPRISLQKFLSEFMFRYNIRDYKTRVSVLSALTSRKSHTKLV